MKKLLSTICLLALVASCASVGERISRLSLGMTKQQVIDTVGKPKSAGGDNGVEVLHYEQDEGWWRFSYYFVRLVDGKVESYGPENRAHPVTGTDPPIKK